MVTTKFIINPFKELLTGLFNSTKISVSICIITALVFSLVFYWNAEFIIAKNYHYLAHSDTDSYVFTTGEVLNFTINEQSKIEVVALGASALREVTLQNSAFKELLSQYSNVDIEFHRMISSSQSILESAAIVQRLAPSLKGLIIIEINPIRMVKGRQVLRQIINTPRLGFNSTLINDYAKLLDYELGTTRLWYRQNSIEMILSRLIYLAKNLVFGPVSKKQHQYWGMTKKQPKAMQLYAQQLSQFLLQNQTERVFSFAILENLILFLQKYQEVKVVLLESPVNPNFVNMEQIQPFYEQHWADMHNFSAKHNIPYLKLEANDKISALQFSDWFHVNDKMAADIYSDELAQRIGNILNTQIKEN